MKQIETILYIRGASTSSILALYDKVWLFCPDSLGETNQTQGPLVLKEKYFLRALSVRNKGWGCGSFPNTQQYLFASSFSVAAYFQLKKTAFLFNYNMNMNGFSLKLHTLTNYIKPDLYVISNYFFPCSFASEYI